MFRVLRTLTQKKMPCDPITVADALVATHEFEATGGVEYIAGILEAVPHSAHVRYYASIVKRESIRRRLIYLAVGAQEDGYDSSVELEPLVSKLSNSLDELIAERSTDLQSTAVVVQKMREEEKNPRYPHPTGIEDLDKQLDGGIRPGQITVIAARPSIGKTSLGMQVCEEPAKRGDTALFLSIEMTSIELMLRAAKQGYKRADELAALPMFIEDQYLDLDDILNCIRLAKRRNALKVVAIDYLQLIRTNDRLQKNEKIERCMAELKWTAKELKIAIVVLAQINRGSDKREDRRPQLSDIKGSGGIEEAADVVMLLHRPEFYNPNDSPGCADIIVAKNRNGSTGTVQVGYVKERTLFVPYSNRPIDLSGYDSAGAPF
jgi:replicative DNA helicase